jgi:hypothetical protein
MLPVTYAPMAPAAMQVVFEKTVDKATVNRY